ncbi:Chitinase 6 [Citrus sinensis]|nr:Chitinase 6 [Citrus sinensis]
MALFNLNKDSLTFLLFGIFTLAIPTIVVSQVANLSDPSCAGKSFYTRDAFLNAANSYPEFGSGSADDSKREIAAFFAHALGATIQRINGALECGGKQPDEVQARIGYYTDYCNKFGVSPGENLSC